MKIDNSLNIYTYDVSNNNGFLSDKIIDYKENQYEVDNGITSETIFNDISNVKHDIYAVSYVDTYDLGRPVKSYIFSIEKGIEPMQETKLFVKGFNAIAKIEDIKILAEVDKIIIDDKGNTKDISGINFYLKDHQLPSYNGFVQDLYYLTKFDVSGNNTKEVFSCRNIFDRYKFEKKIEDGYSGLTTKYYTKDYDLYDASLVKGACFIKKEDGVNEITLDSNVNPSYIVINGISYETTQENKLFLENGKYIFNYKDVEHGVTFLGTTNLMMGLLIPPIKEKDDISYTGLTDNKKEYSEWSGSGGVNSGSINSGGNGVIGTKFKINGIEYNESNIILYDNSFEINVTGDFGKVSYYTNIQKQSQQLKGSTLGGDLRIMYEDKCLLPNTQPPNTQPPNYNHFRNNNKVPFLEYNRCVGLPFSNINMLNITRNKDKYFFNNHDIDNNLIPNNNEIPFNLTGLNNIRANEHFNYIDGKYIHADKKKKMTFLVIEPSPYKMLTAFDSDTFAGVINMDTSDVYLNIDYSGNITETDKNGYNYTYMEYQDLASLQSTSLHSIHSHYHGNHVSSIIASKYKDIAVAFDARILFMFGTTSIDDGEIIRSFIEDHRDTLHIVGYNGSYGNPFKYNFINETKDENISIENDLSNIKFWRSSTDGREVYNCDLVIKIKDVQHTDDFFENFNKISEIDDFFSIMACGNDYTEFLHTYNNNLEEYNLYKGINVFLANNPIKIKFNNEEPVNSKDLSVESKNNIYNILLNSTSSRATLANFSCGSVDCLIPFNMKDQATRTKPGELSSFSNRNLVDPFYPNQDSPIDHSSNFICAPGNNIYASIGSKSENGLDDDNTYSLKSGTSMSSPFLSGCIVLICDVFKTVLGEDNLPSHTQMKEILAKGADIAYFKNEYEIKNLDGHIQKYKDNPNHPGNKYFTVNIYKSIDYIYKNIKKFTNNNTIQGISYNRNELSLDKIHFDDISFSDCSFIDVPFSKLTSFKNTTFKNCNIDFLKSTKNATFKNCKIITKGNTPSEHKYFIIK